MDDMRLVIVDSPSSSFSSSSTPHDGQVIDLDPQSPDFPRALADAYPWPSDRTWMRANMVVTVDGRAQADDGLTAGISSPEDKAVFGFLRRSCDAVLVGAGTARSEGYRALRRPGGEGSASTADLPAPVLAIVSESLEFDLDSDIFTAAGHVDGVHRPLIITSGASDPSRRDRLAPSADVVICGESQVDPSLIKSALQERGLSRIVCEGGPHLLTDLLHSGAIDELDLTISPLLLMRPSGDLLAGAGLRGPALSLRLSHILEADSTLMLRYLVTHPTVPST
jgi:riboflavin biosynthesis pyrimidine reductase